MAPNITHAVGSKVRYWYQYTNPWYGAEGVVVQSDEATTQIKLTYVPLGLTYKVDQVVSLCTERLRLLSGAELGEPELESGMEPVEAVVHPAHYGGDTTYEAIKVIEAWGLGFHLGNTVKYISRAGKKAPAKLLEDLKKARWYLDRKIAKLEAGAAE